MQTVHDEITRRLPLTTDARRLFHGRGHCFVGLDDLTIDYFPPVVMIILHRERDQGWLEELQRTIVTAMPEPPEAILLQERFLRDSPSRMLAGELPEELDAHEEGLLFRLRLGEAQNIGFFPDMASGRKLVQERAAGKKILNLFAYSCAFSVAALAGDAAQVVNLDMNRGALELGKLNHRLNGFDLRKASFLSMEFFRSVSKLRKIGPFDLVICDPPASQGKSFTAEHHWPKLVDKLPSLVRSGGEVLACLNAPELGPNYLDELFSQKAPGAKRLNQLTPGGDFPERDLAQGVTLHLYRMP